MTPSTRDMFVVDAHATSLGWRLFLPGNRVVFAASKEQAQQIVAREACGATIRFIEKR